MTEPSLAVAILAYNGRPYLGPCLDTVLAQDPPPTEIVVLDNASTDGSADFVAECYPQVRLVRSETNLGVAGGLNELMRLTQAPVVALLNQDVELRAGCLAGLAAAFGENVAVVGAKLLFPDGQTVQHAGGYLEMPGYLGQHHGFGQPDDGRWDVARPIDYVTGAVFAVSRAAWDALGGLDLLFSPAYYEETDFCLRAQAAGWRVVYQPAAVAIHHESTTLGRESRRYLDHYHRHRLLLALKHAPIHNLLVHFGRTEAARLAALRQSPEPRDRDQVESLAAAFVYAQENLPTILERRSDAPLASGTVWAINDMLGLLRRIAEQDEAVENWQWVPLPTDATIALRDRILRAEQSQTIHEVPFTSPTPVLGPLLVRIRALWNWMSTKWYVRPMVEQQNRYNAEVVATLRAVLAELEASRQERDRVRLDLAQAVKHLDELLSDVEPQIRSKLGQLADKTQSNSAAVLADRRRIAELTRRLTVLENQLAEGRRHAARPVDGGLTVEARTRRPRLAFFSPLSPQASGIAAYSEALLPALAEQAEVEVFIGDFTPTDPAVKRLPVFSFRDYPARRHAYGYAATIYQMGNHYAYHAPIYQTLRRYPGIVVLHEWVLHHFIAGATIDQGRGDEYVWEMGYAAGVESMDTARAALRGATLVPFHDYPLVEPILDMSLGVICHSQFVAERVRAQRPELPVAVVAHPTEVTRVTSVERREDPSKPLTVITAGYLTPAKGLTVSLHAFARFLKRHPEAKYILVGATEPGFDPLKLAAQAGIAHAVEWRGYAGSLAEFDARIAGADVCLNLRYPTAGETSGSLLRVMGLGVPAIVTNIGWFSEAPDDTCLKVPAPPTPEAVAAALETLAADPARRRAMADAARHYVETQHTPARTAADYLDFIARLNP